VEATHLAQAPAQRACRFLMRPAYAVFSNPGRCSSIRLKAIVSFEGRPSHVAVAADIFM